MREGWDRLHVGRRAARLRRRGRRRCRADRLYPIVGVSAYGRGPALLRPVSPARRAIERLQADRRPGRCGLQRYMLKALDGQQSRLLREGVTESLCLRGVPHLHGATVESIPGLLAPHDAVLWRSGRRWRQSKVIKGGASASGRTSSQFGIVLPPLPEQRRIVDLIGALDDAIAAAIADAINAARKQAVLLEAFLARLPKPRRSNRGEGATCCFAIDRFEHKSRFVDQALGCIRRWADSHPTLRVGHDASH